MPRAPDETIFDLFLTTRANVIYTRRQHRGTNTYFAARECVCLACCELDEEVLPLKVAGVGYNGVAAPQGSEYGLMVGNRVVVHGMKRDVTLNGMSGSVQGVQDTAVVVRMDAEQGGTKALRPCNIAKLLGAEMMAPFTAPAMATMNAPIQAFGPASVATRSTAQTPNTAGMFPTGARVVMHGLQSERHRALNLTCGTVVAVQDGSVLVKTDKALAPEGTSQTLAFDPNNLTLHEEVPVAQGAQGAPTAAFAAPTADASVLDPELASSLGSHLAQAGPTLIRLGVRDASDLSLLHESDLEELPLVTRRKVLSLAEP